MKQIKKTTETVSEDMLRKILREELKNYPTRSEIHSELIEQERRFDDKAREYRDQILNKMDGVMGELAQNRENYLFIDNDVKNLKENVDSHEKRLIKLEHS